MSQLTGPRTSGLPATYILQKVLWVHLVQYPPKANK